MQRVIVLPYDPAWPIDFAREAAVVASAAGESHLATHHIGSTAIPGIYAKPIIDLLLVVADISLLDGRNPQFQSIGYEVMGEFGIPSRRYFRKENVAGVRTHQIHAFQTGSPHISRHLAFRDFMRAHAEPALQYSELKWRLAERHPDDINAYMDGKDEFIKRIDALAAAWVRGAAEQVAGAPSPANSGCSELKQSLE